MAKTALHMAITFWRCPREVMPGAIYAIGTAYSDDTVAILVAFIAT
jgi:hypothetical protein